MWTLKKLLDWWNSIHLFCEYEVIDSCNYTFDIVSSYCPSLVYCKNKVGVITISKCKVCGNTCAAEKTETSDDGYRNCNIDVDIAKAKIANLRKK